MSSKAADRGTFIVVSILLFGNYALAQGNTNGPSKSSAVDTAHPTAVLALFQKLGAWWAKPTQPLDVQPHLPAARPQQPWPYRPLSSALHASVTGTESYAMQATVQHAPLKDITSEMMEWWLNNIEGEAPYTGDGRVWSKYLQWHPRDHMYQISVPAPAEGASSSSSSSSSASAPQGPLWEICEYFMCPEPAGYTAANYHPGPQHDSNYVIKEVTELQHLGSHSMMMTVPARWGIGSTIWHLKHTWRDSPEGLLVNSTQVIGVVEPGWRPMWFARWRNALVRGMFARVRNPVWMLQQWVQHCVEEIGNLEHILPSLYAARGQTAAAAQPASPQGSVAGRATDEL